MNEKMETNKDKEKSETTHKLGIYLWIWGLLFVLSFFSNVDEQKLNIISVARST